jgi:outer membrane protein OmpA-like peptidoglycan-associated protein
MESRPTLFMGTARKKQKLESVQERQELTPLDSVSIANLQKQLNPQRIARALAAYFNAGGSKSKGWRAVYEILEPLGSFHGSDMKLVGLFARRILTINKWTSDRKITRSQIDWIQSLLDREANAIPRWLLFLGLKPNPRRGVSDDQHTYEVTMTLTGLSFVAGGYTGSITVKKTNGRKFEKTFDIDLIGGTIALTLFDYKVGDKFSGAGRSYVEWTENDIPGDVNYARASASFGFDVASAQLGFMHILGNETLPPLEILFQDAGLGPPDVKSIYIKQAENALKGEAPSKGDLFDVSASVLTGSISTSIINVLRGKKPLDDIDLSKKWVNDEVIERTLGAELHFCLDRDTLTDEGRQALRLLCARELPALSTPGASLVVVGHADTLGKASYNFDLSKRRADKVVEAMKDILGPKLRIKNVATYGMGEIQAYLAAKGKTKPAPEHRRVEIFLNAKLVLSLVG